MGGRADVERLAAVVGPIFFSRFVLNTDLSDDALAAIVDPGRG